MKLLRACAASLLLLVVVAPVLADIAVPDRKKVHKPEEVRGDLPFSHMTIESVAGLREARLQVPRALLGKLSPATPAAAGGVDTGAQSGALRTFGTAAAGLFLSLSVVMAGLLLVRSRRRLAGRAVAAALVCAFAAAAAAVAAYANAAPPLGWRTQDPGTLTRAASSQQLAGSVRIEVVEDGSDIKLLIPAGDDSTKKPGGEE